MIHVTLYKETCTFTWICLAVNTKQRHCRPRFEAKFDLRCIDLGIPPSQSTWPVNYFILLKCQDNLEFKISMQNHHKKALACFIWKFPQVNLKCIFYFKHSIIWFWIHVSTIYYITYDVIRQCRLQKHIPKTHGIVQPDCTTIYQLPFQYLMSAYKTSRPNKKTGLNYFHIIFRRKKDLLAAVQGSCLQYCTITLAKYARLKSCKEHGAAGKECVTLCTKRSRGKTIMLS